MVTHDRIFLDQVCDRILELDQGSLYEYVDCDYAGYLQAKEERLALQDAAAQSAIGDISKRVYSQLSSQTSLSRPSA